MRAASSAVIPTESGAAEVRLPHTKVGAPVRGSVEATSDFRSADEARRAGATRAGARRPAEAS